MSQQSKNQKVNLEKFSHQYYRWGILVLLGIYILLSAVYGSVFAKIHLDVPVIHLPLFIGEWLFLTTIFSYLSLRNEVKTRQMHLRFWGALTCYIGVLLILTAGKNFGLSLRNAAMYYYTFFALFSFAVLNGLRVPRVIHIILILVIGAACQVISPDSYFRFSFIAIAIALILQLPNGRSKLILSLVLALMSHPDYLFIGSRTNLVSCVSALTFLVIILSIFWMKQSKRYKVAGIILGLALIMIAVWLRADRNGVISMLTPGTQIHKLDQWDQILSTKHYVPLELRPQMYSVNGFLSKDVNAQPVVHASIKPPDMDKPPVPFPTKVITDQSTVSHHQVQAVMIPEKHERVVVDPGYTIRSNTVILQETANYRPLSVAYGNTAFRLFIWRDMLEELWESKALFGFGLGHPQRSKRIETLNWAASEWQRDGWITPHNFTLHLIYRSGIIGLVLLLVIILHVFRMIQRFILLRSLSGVLLGSVLFYWLVAAQFLVILELPYYAIPFWVFYGATWFFSERLLKNS